MDAESGCEDAECYSGAEIVTRNQRIAAEILSKRLAGVV
jgi:hypothetical protein